MSDPRRDFIGAKVMVFLGAEMIVLRRDHAAGIAWPGGLDFPGGGREDGESPEACAARETHEEVGLRLSPGDLVFVQLRQARAGTTWHFAAHLPAGARNDVVFGGEGVGWSMMQPRAYLADPDAIPPFRRILAAYLRRLAAKH